MTLLTADQLEAAAKAGYDAAIGDIANDAEMEKFGLHWDPNDPEHAWEAQSDGLREFWRRIVSAITTAIDNG